MPNVVFRGRSLALQGGETVLECLERHGAQLPFSCRAGHCRTCEMRAVDSSIPAHAQPDFSEAERRQGRFLPCVCRPTSDLVVTSDDSGPGMPTTVIRRDALSADVVRLELVPSLPFPFLPGQFVHVVGPTNAVRPYSVASEPDGPIELHIRRRAGGAVSPWLADEVQKGATVHLRGPFGHCHYREQDAERPLLLVGFSTGLAPLLGVVRDALARGHTPNIAMYHFARTQAGLYLCDPLTDLANQHDNVEVNFSVLGNDASGDIGDSIEQTIAHEIADLDKRRIFICGSPVRVARLQRALSAAGEAPLDINVDPFFYDDRRQ